MVSVIFEIAASLFQSIMIIWFVSRFNRRRWFGDKLAVIFTVVTFVVTLFNDRFFPGFSVPGLMMIFSAALIYALIICNKAYAKAILSDCLIHTIIMIGSTVTYAAVSVLIKDFDIVMQGTDSVARYVYVVIANLFTFAIARLVLSIFKVDDTLELKTGIIMFTTTFITLIGFTTTTKIAVAYQNYDIAVSVIVLTLVFLAINVILYTLVGQIQKLQRKKYELQLIAEKLSFEENRINDSNAMLDTCRKMKHDMKQHLTVIGGYLEDGKEDECKAYVAKLNSSAEQIGSLIQSGNTVIDYLINAKLNTLEDTQVIVSGNIGDLSDISDVDLSCIIGNILDNAVEAVRPLKEKRIELKFAMQNSNRIIICRNTINESVLKKNRFLSTTKDNADEHGFGHKIVASVVESYDGMISYFEENGMFGVQIILPIKN